jgi:hypothetical protein
LRTPPGAAPNFRPQQLEQLLHVDVPLLRNPLTALSLFAPLLTSVLAVFIPQLTSG